MAILLSNKHCKPKILASILCALTMLISGCASGDVLYLNAYPPGPLHAGDAFQFAATVNGASATAGVEWTVKDTASPSQTGRITQDGLYTAPKSLQSPITVTVQAALNARHVVSEIPVQVLPAVPVVSSVSEHVVAPGPLNLQLAGLNLLPQTVALINGVPQDMKSSGATTASISGLIPQGTATASLVLQNPWDEDTSAPLDLLVQTSAPYPPSGGSSPPTSTLTGCANPNMGTPSGDWGVGTDPVYVDPTGVTVGSPVYNSNSIFWISRETGPGQSVLMTGAFTGAQKTARVAPIPAGTTNWQNLVQSSRAVVRTTQQGTTALSFIIPPTFPPGVYGFEIDDPGAPPVLGLANVPRISWAIGTPSAGAQPVPLQNQVYDCGAQAGGMLNLFGKNFVATDKVVLEAPDGTTYPLEPATADSNSISVMLPDTLESGIYSVWVGGSLWDATSSAADQIAIFPPQQLSTKTVQCQGLIGDGATDNSAALQECLDSQAPAAGSGTMVYLNVPEGTFLLREGITGHPYEVLMGASSQNTKFVGKPSGSPPAAWITMPQYFGMIGFSLTAPADPDLIVSDTSTGDPLSSGHLFVDDVKLESTADTSNGAEILAEFSGPDIQVYNSFFLSNSNQAFALVYADGAVISGNEFVLNNSGISITNSQNVEFEDNLVHSYNPLGQGQWGNSAGSGLAINRANSQYGTSAVSQDIYVGYNTFKNVGSEDQQVITNDGGGGAYFGPVAASTPGTVTLADDPAWNWMGTTNPEASAIAIVSGTGAGQYSFIKSYSGRTINLVAPWKVAPDASSIVAIVQYQLNVTIAHNFFANVLGCPACLEDALEGVLEDNTVVSSSAMDSMQVGGFGPYGGPAGFGPSIDMDVLRNTVPYLSIQDMPGCLVSGMLIRGNVVPSTGFIADTNGDAGISGVLIEQNQATWNQTWFYTPGFLVQDNFPPP